MKNLLRDGVMVELRNKDTRIVVGDFLVDKDFKLQEMISYYDDNLCHLYKENNEELDIMRVMEIRESFPAWDTIWRREEEKGLDVDWFKVPKFTPVQVRDDNEHEWKNAYFCKARFSSSCDNIFFVFGIRGEVFRYKHCRIHPDFNVEDYWK